MSPDFEAQKELLLANVLMHQGRYDEAIHLLSGWRGGPVWSAYARFNLGVALVRNNRLADAAPFLTGVGTHDRRHPGAAGVAGSRQSRARLRLPAGESARPRALRRSRACASTARTRTRRCSASAGRTRRSGTTSGALTPWMELRGRDVLDAAVQESYLAVPYAFGKLNANAQSAQYYESAVVSFDAENGRLDAAITAHRAG